MTELKESLPAERKSDEEVQTSSLSIKDRIRRLQGITKPNENYQETIHEGVAAAVREEKTQTKLKESTKVPEGMRKETKSQQKKFKEKLEDEKEKATREERSRVQLNEKIKDLEDMRMELESQQKALKDSLVQEKRKVSCEKRSRVKVEKKLKKVKERNTKLEDEVRQLKERLLAEESISKEVQTSSLKAEISRISLEKTKAMLEKEDLNKQLAAEQGKGKDMKESLSQNLIAKKDSMKSSFFPEQSVFDSAMMEQNIRYAERRKRRSRSRSRRRAREMMQRRDSTENMDTLDEDIGRRKGSRGRSLTRDRRLGCSPKMQRRHSAENMGYSAEDMERSRGRGRRRTRDRRLSFSPKMREHSTEKMHAFGVRRGPMYVETGTTTEYEMRKHSTENIGTQVETRLRKRFVIAPPTNNESTSGYETANVSDLEGILRPGSASAAKIQHDEPCSTTDPANDNKDVPSYPDGTSDTNACKGDSDEEEFLDGKSKLEVCARVSVEGANLQIADTGVSLSIPPGALSEEQTILMKIIPQPCDAQDALKFECNSVVVVELLPNNCRFQCPVSLTLPHCLQLKEECERNSIDVLISHHDEGFKPKWELLHDAKFNLCEENCTISLNSFCWVTYEIHDKIVEAKRIKLYTAGKKMRLKDRITEVEVGFYPDLPGSGKILELNKDMHLSQRKPFVFLKTGEEPLLINLHKVVPKEWNNSQPDENPKIIPFDSVSISEERSCPFVLERSGDDTDIPLCIFKVGQKGRNDVELTIRPDVLTA